ncbi:MAG: glutamyl-tRNA reductase [Ginsengibacter sp.]
MLNSYHNLSRFCIAGINYRKSDIGVRGSFSLSPKQSEQLLEETIEKKFGGCFVLSTCNRTEVYGICDDPEELRDMLCIHTHGTKTNFKEHGYIKTGIDAAEHLFRVAAGLDSQIIGDCEILSQLKHAARSAKLVGSLDSFMERMINFALQASKEIKTSTSLSSGTVSVAYAAIEIIKEKVSVTSRKKILLVGTGKFGNHIAKNLNSYLPEYSISFANRTDEKAFRLSGEYNSAFVPYHLLASAAENADIIIVSSSAENYLISPLFFTTSKPRLILDLSVPRNVDPAIKLLANITLMNVDEISHILDKTISLRQAEVPAAMQIIQVTIQEMISWYRNQAHNPLLRKVKSQLYELRNLNGTWENEGQSIHKTVTSLAISLRAQNNKGCQCIHALSSYLHTNYATTG